MAGNRPLSLSLSRNEPNRTGWVVSELIYISLPLDLIGAGARLTELAYCQRQKYINLVFVYLVTKMTRAVPFGLMSHPMPCRTFRGKRHPSGYTLGNYNTSSKPGARRSLLPLYSALSFSLPLPSPPSLSQYHTSLSHGSLVGPFTSSRCLLAWDPNFIPRYHIWATQLRSTKCSS